MRGIEIENVTSEVQQYAGNMRADSISSGIYEDESLPSMIPYMSEFLDRILPLDSASHAEVVTYAAEISMRYAKCFATLQDGRKVGLQNSRSFVGWLDWNRRRSLLFRTNGLQIEIQSNTDHPAGRGTPGYVCEVIVETIADARTESFVSSRTRQQSNQRKFIAIDSSQIVLSGRR